MSFIANGIGSALGIGGGSGASIQQPAAINTAGALQQPAVSNEQNQIQQYLQQLGTQQAPVAQTAQLGPAAQAQATQINTGAINGVTAQQQQLANLLGGQVAGTAPSLAAAQLQQGTAANIAGAQALAQAAQGPNASLNKANLANQTANLNQQAAGQAGLQTIQQQQAAIGNQANVLGAMQNTNQNVATSQAGLTQQAALANAGATNQFGLQQGTMQQQTNLQNQAAQLQAMGLSQQAILQLLGQNENVTSQQQQVNLGLNQQQMANTALANQSAIQGNQQQGNLLNALGTTAGNLGALGLFSDVRTKKNISTDITPLHAFLDSIDPVQYKYKPEYEADSKGLHLGILAQDLEKTPLGKKMVSIDTASKMKKVTFDANSLSTMLAALADQHARLKSLEA